VFVNLREVWRVAVPALLICAVAWLVLLARPGMLHPHIHDVGSGAMAPTDLGRMLLSLLPGWFAMLAAMMPPALISPIVYVRSRSFACRRQRSVALFIGGYIAIWTVAFVVLIPIQIAERSLVSQFWIGASAAIIVALVWQSCPIKQICLNRCHAHRELAAFGYAADRDAVRFGLEQGIYCAGSCWALMLLPMLLPAWHLAAMAIATIVILADRIERPTTPNWRWRGVDPLLRMVTARANVPFRNFRTVRASIWPA
jgi:predicted metal-binding membrane protein